jgi:hypothetical protein
VHPLSDPALRDPGRPRRRWVWPALAAVLLLAIPLVTVLLVRHGRTDGQPAHPAPNSKLIAVGPVRWLTPVWTGHSIVFTVWLPVTQVCKAEPSFQGKVTADTATSVTIVVTEYIDPDPAAESARQKRLCSGPISATATESYPGEVALPRPLNGRSVVDGTSHNTLRVLDASVVPDVPGLPSGFHSQGYYGRTQPDVVGRSWIDDRVQFTLSIEPTNAISYPESKPSTIGLVNGHPTEFRDRGRHSIAWQDGAITYQIEETPLVALNDWEFSPEQLLELARSVR